jgi:serine/threonine protein kinase
MGTVWLARMTGKHGFERLVALKTILSTYGNDRQFCDMFLDEARIAAQIDHENVARILEIGEDRGNLYHAMELIDGESLRKLYRDIRAVNAPFPLGVALRIAADTCAGLHAVHELKGPDGRPLEVVHRDVSPQNILVTIRGTIKLIDFGVAKARERRTEETTAGTLKGKIEYMAPEQARGEKMDRRADVYAIGAVLYELLAGEPVRSTEEGRQLLALHELMTGAPYEPLHSSIPLPVRTLVDRALARDPQLRFRTTEDMRHSLEQVMHTLGQPTTSDDVANVLTHFSRERTQRRKDAIEAAVRAATEKAISNPHVSQHTVVAPLAPPLPGGQGIAIPYGSEGPHGTRLMSSVNGMPIGSGSGNGPVSEGPSTGPSMTTGPSMRTMQGASMSGAPPAPTTSIGKVLAALIVLSLVAVLGVVAGVVVTRGNGNPTNAAGGGGPTATAAIPTTEATLADAAAPEARVPVPGDPNGGVILGASNPGTVGSAGAGVGVGADAGKKKVGPPGTGGKGKGAAGGQKSDGDDYGF